MALREGGCLLDRRFADRGNDIKVFYSRARGEDRRPTRRVADRGSDGVYHDPRDLEEIRRLRQRVQDLEEIIRLRQRVRDLELQRERRVKETESRHIVRDNVYEEEEYPFDRHPPWFYEPLYPEGVSEDKPRFDEDGIGFDEEEFRFVKTVLGGNTIFENEPKKETYGKVPVIVDEFVGGKKAICEAMVAGGDLVAGGAELVFDVPITLSTNMEELNVHSQFLGSSMNLKFLIGENNGVAKDNDSDLGHTPNKLHGKAFKLQIPDYDPTKNIGRCEVIQNRKETKHACMRGTCRWPPLDNSHVSLYYKISNIKKPKVTKVNVHGGPVKMKKGNEVHGLQLYANLVGTVLFERVKLIWNIRRFNPPFDPGGTNLESGEMTSEVEVLRWVVIVMQKNRVDVPFDPGGFGSEAKLEDEFFFEEGEYDAGAF